MVFLVTMVYGSPNSIQRWDLWGVLTSIVEILVGPCLIGANFNAILANSKQWGGALRVKYHIHFLVI